jgi:predicted HAD superfamily Cof-like phosphohydrolase
MTWGRFRIKRLWLCLLAVCLASITSSRVFAQTAPAPVCDPSPEIKAALDSVPDVVVYPEYWRHYQQRQLSAIQAILDRHPGDFFARRAYQVETGLLSSEQALREAASRKQGGL